MECSTCAARGAFAGKGCLGKPTGEGMVEGLQEWRKKRL